MKIPPKKKHFETRFEKLKGEKDLACLLMRDREGEEEKSKDQESGDRSLKH